MKAPVRKPLGDFVEAPSPRKNAVVILFGPTGGGKTTSALSAVQKQVHGAYIDTERRGLWAVQRREEELGTKLLYLPLDYLRKAEGMNDAEIISTAGLTVKRMMTNYETALKASITGEVGTIIIDTASEYYKSTLFLSIFGRTDKVIQRDHGIPRAAFRAMVRMAREYPVNLILICHEREEYVNNVPSGRMTWAGFDEMGADVDFAARVTIDKPKRVKEGEPSIYYKWTIVKAGVEAETLDAVYTQEDWEPFGPFVYACMQQFVGTSPEDWGWSED